MSTLQNQSEDNPTYPTNQLSHKPDLDGPTTWHQTGDDGRLDATTLAIVARALKNGGAVLVQGGDEIELTLIVVAQIEAAP